MTANKGFIKDCVQEKSAQFPGGSIPEYQTNWLFLQPRGGGVKLSPHLPLFNEVNRIYVFEYAKSINIVYIFLMKFAGEGNGTLPLVK